MRPDLIPALPEESRCDQRADRKRRTGHVTAAAAAVDMRIEVIVVPVSDVDRAKEFYSRLGWRLDADVATGDDFRLVQLTPPGSPCSVQLGTGLTSAAPGSLESTYLVVSDIATVRDELAKNGVRGDRCLPLRHRVRLPLRRRERPGTRERAGRQLRLVRLVQRPGRQHAGCCRRSRPGSPGASTPQRRRSGRPAISPPRCAAPPRRTASTRRAPGRPTRTGPTGTPSTWSVSRPVRSCRHDARPRRHRDRRRLAG